MAHSRAITRIEFGCIHRKFKGQNALYEWYSIGFVDGVCRYLNSLTHTYDKKKSIWLTNSETRWITETSSCPFSGKWAPNGKCSEARQTAVVSCDQEIMQEVSLLYCVPDSVNSVLFMYSNCSTQWMPRDMKISTSGFPFSLVGPLDPEDEHNTTSRKRWKIFSQRYRVTISSL